MSNKFYCEIVTTEKELFKDEVHFVAVPGSDGELGFLANRAPIVSTLKLGEIRVQVDEGTTPLSYVVDGGYVEALGEKLVVLATRAVNTADIKLQETREYLSDCKKKLADADEDDSRTKFYEDEVAFYTLLEAKIAAKS